MSIPGQGIRLRSFARTSTGKVRENNEDNVHLWSHDHLVLATVADGMGGAVAGEEASRIAVETIERMMTLPDSDGAEKYGLMDANMLADQLKEVIRAANGTIYANADQHPELKGMGTTITTAFVRNTDVIVGHVGDSRAYLVDGHDGHIIQITADHSFVQALVSAGHITEEEAEDHPMRNVLYRALGQARDVEVDFYYERLQVSDRLVLCSDGLTLHVKPQEIAQLTLGADNPEDASRKLIDLANSRGGRDNVSVIVIKLERVPGDEFEEITADVHQAGFDDDTLVIVPRESSAYASSESQNVPDHREAERDSATNRRDHPGPPSAMLPRRWDFTANLRDKVQSLKPELAINHALYYESDEYGEGRDTMTPDQ
jgi:protein phosphatase